MARHNIIFGRDDAVRQGSPAPVSANTQWSSSFDTQADPYGRTAAPGQSADSLEAMYARPAATSHDTGRMSMRDALNSITATLAIVLVIGSFVALTPVVLGVVAGEQGKTIGLALGGIATIVGALGGLILGLVNSFKRNPSAVLVLAYAVFEGLLLGGLSGAFESIYPGIALQAVVATFAVAGVVLVLTQLGVLRTSPALTKVFLYATLAYLAFSLFNLVYVLATGGSLRTGMIGMAIGALAVVMASYSLVMDIEDVKRAVNTGAPRNYAWRCAFGVTVTLVWMYVEILRILAIFRD